MGWKIYEVILRLHSPLHIGWRKVGNLQITRPYVTGRNLWGALTMRLTRDAAQGRGPATNSSKYRSFGEQVHESLAFTYFYLAIKEGSDYRVAWPWKNESAFRRRFLGSYAGTALSHSQRSAAEGMLHEVEFITPHAFDTGEAVFLKGYVFEKDECTLDWKSALKRLQMGGERGYGWGDVELMLIKQPTDTLLFDGPATFRGDDDVPIISLPTDGRLLAHTRSVAGLPIAGEVEPLVGREWRSDNPRRRYVGQHVEYTDTCFSPGSTVHQSIDFTVSKFGLWQKLA